jgi:hypothetical protein
VDQPTGWSTIWSKKPETTHLQNVSDLINEDTMQWKDQVLNQNFYPMEAAQISAILLANKNSEDLISWYGTKMGITQYNLATMPS